MRYVFLSLFLALPVAGIAEVVVPARTIRAKEVITPEMLTVLPDRAGTALSDPQAAIGREARVTLYAGRPIQRRDLQPPALVRRNDPVLLRFSTGPLQITTEGRALGRGAAGDTVRAMNLASRTTVTGLVAADGSIEVRQ